MKAQYPMYIDGEWTAAADGSLFEDINPYTGQTFASVANGSRADAEKAVVAAHSAFPGWASTPPGEKRLIFLKAAEILETRQKDIARLLAVETGTTIAFAGYQAKLAPNYFREAACQVHRITGKILPSDIPGSFSMVMRRPLGVVSGISPWNAPVALSLRTICWPLACGNTVVLKPSAESPITGGVVMAQLMEAAGLPRGVLNVVTNGPGRAKAVGDVLVTDPRVRRISFTGSTETGRRLAELAGRHLKKSSIELGGNDPMIVLKDADLDYAVNAAVFGRFVHQGQVCMGVKRIIVDKSVIGEFTEKLVGRASGMKTGDPMDPATIIGPLINQRQLDTLKTQVKATVSEGATLLCGGTHDGLCFAPTVLVGVTEQMTAFREETFGPVASIVAAEDAEDALRLANCSEFGLSSAIMTQDTQKALEMAERLETGMIHINDSTVHSETHAPSGGVKNSGWGRNGMEAVDEFTELHWITLQKTARRFPF